MMKILIVILSFVGSACAEQKDMKQLYYKGDEDYSKQVKSFKVNYDEALHAAIKHHRKSTPRGVKVATGKHELIVGDWYLFSFSEKTKIPLRGVYVHGQNGKVIVLETSKSIKRGEGLKKIELIVK